MLVGSCLIVQRIYGRNNEILSNTQIKTARWLKKKNLPFFCGYSKQTTNPHGSSIFSRERTLIIQIQRVTDLEEKLRQLMGLSNLPIDQAASPNRLGLWARDPPRRIPALPRHRLASPWWRALSSAPLPRNLLASVPTSSHLRPSTISPQSPYKEKVREFRIIEEKKREKKKETNVPKEFAGPYKIQAAFLTYNAFGRLSMGAH